MLANSRIISCILSLPLEPVPQLPSPPNGSVEHAQQTQHASIQIESVNLGKPCDFDTGDSALASNDIIAIANDESVSKSYVEDAAPTESPDTCFLNHQSVYDEVPFNLKNNVKLALLDFAVSIIQSSVSPGDFCIHFIGTIIKLFMNRLIFVVVVEFQLKYTHTCPFFSRDIDCMPL